MVTTHTDIDVRSTIDAFKRQSVVQIRSLEGHVAPSDSLDAVADALRLAEHDND